MDFIHHLRCLRASLSASGVSAFPAGTIESSIPVLFCWGCMPAVSYSLLMPLHARSGAALLCWKTLSLYKRMQDMMTARTVLLRAREVS